MVAVLVCILTNSIRGFPFLQTLSSTFVVLSILSSVRCYLIVVLICISLIMNDVEHLFMCLLARCMSSLERCLFSSLALFWLGNLFSWYWATWADCLFLRLILCQLLFCYYFLSFWRLSFHLAYSFLRCAKAFKFN